MPGPVQAVWGGPAAVPPAAGQAARVAHPAARGRVRHLLAGAALLLAGLLPAAAPAAPATGAAAGKAAPDKAAGKPVGKANPAEPDLVLPAGALSESARDVLARTRPSVVQIKGFFGANSAQAFHGTGFAVGPGGLLLTNYHVVAELVAYPEKYRLEFRTPEGKTGKIAVLAIDVLHDLALVRAEAFDATPLNLARSIPAKGTRAYSIGFPLDVGLTITEGVSNGKVEDSFEARIHYSGAINGGMSGGPALNTAGEVIGINVSGYRDEQSVSFLVPAEHGRALLEHVPTEPLKPAEAKKEVGRQLRIHGADLLASFPGAFTTQTAAGYTLPGKLSGFVDCNASGDTTADQPVQTERIFCGAKAGLYVQENLRSGDLRFQHFVLTTAKLDAWRFAHHLQNISGPAGGGGNREHVGPFACKGSTVKLHGFDAGLVVCTRGYRKFEGLYDINARLVSLNEPKRGFASRLAMTGVDFTAGMAFVRRYVEAMQWQP